MPREHWGVARAVASEACGEGSEVLTHFSSQMHSLSTQLQLTDALTEGTGLINMYAHLLAPPPPEKKKKAQRNWGNVLQVVEDRSCQPRLLQSDNCLPGKEE